MEFYIEMHAKWNVIVAYEERILYQLIIPIVNFFVFYLTRKFFFIINQGCDTIHCPYGRCKQQSNNKIECECKQCSPKYSNQELICGDNGITYP